MAKREKTDSLERPGTLRDVKIVLVGPAKCGKTALVQRFVNDTFNETYIPTGFEKYSTKQKIGEFTVEYQIWDTSGGGAYDSVRPLAYQDANVFMLCFNVGDQESLTSAINKWCIEIRRHCCKTPIILCGCRADSRSVYNTITYSAQARIPVTSEQALLACNHIGAVAYVETSSQYSNILVPEAFKIAAEIALGLINTSSLCNQTSSTTTSSSSSSVTTTTTTTATTNSKSMNKKVCKDKKSYSISSPSLNRISSGKPDIKNDVHKTAKNCCIM